MLKTETYKELLALGQLYLLQEHSWQEQVVVDPVLVKALKMRKPAPPAIPTPTEPQAIRMEPRPVPIPPPPQIVPKAAPSTPPPVQQSIAPQAPAQAPVSEPPVAPSPVVTEEKKKAFLELQPMGAAAARENGELLRLIKQVYPNFSYIEKVPDDSEAKALGRQWDLNALEAEIFILSFSEVPKQVAFLQNIAKALRFGGRRATVIKAQSVEEKDGWAKIIQNDQTKCLIASDYGIYTLEKFMPFVKINDKGQHHAGTVPLFLMADVALYFKEPHLKAALWKALESDLLPK